MIAFAHRTEWIGLAVGTLALLGAFLLAAGAIWAARRKPITESERDADRLVSQKRGDR